MDHIHQTTRASILVFYLKAPFSQRIFSAEHTCACRLHARVLLNTLVRNRYRCGWCTNTYLAFSHWKVNRWTRGYRPAFAYCARLLAVSTRMNSMRWSHDAIAEAKGVNESHRACVRVGCGANRRRRVRVVWGQISHSVFLKSLSLNRGEIGGSASSSFRTPPIKFMAVARVAVPWRNAHGNSAAGRHVIARLPHPVQSTRA